MPFGGWRERRFIMRWKVVNGKGWSIGMLNTCNWSWNGIGIWSPLLTCREFPGRRWIISLSGMSIFPIWWSFIRSSYWTAWRRRIRDVMIGWWSYCCLWYIRRLITRNRTVISWQIRRVRIGIGRWSIGGGCWRNTRRVICSWRHRRKKMGYWWSRYIIVLRQDFPWYLLRW